MSNGHALPTVDVSIDLLPFSKDPTRRCRIRLLLLHFVTIDRCSISSLSGEERRGFFV